MSLAKADRYSTPEDRQHAEIVALLKQLDARLAAILELLEGVVHDQGGSTTIGTIAVKEARR